jgi:glycosyltransferase involved in cell wall biosynthesis
MVSVIIPAFNEEKTIGQIIVLIKKFPIVQEVLVIDDGSQDNTAKIALEKGARVIRIPKNKGKGQALDLGVKKAESKVLFFLDADLKGLLPKHLELLIKPVITKKLDMTIGMVDRFKGIRIITSPFAGTRVLKRSFWQEIPQEFKKGFFIESALTYFAKKKKLNVKGFVLKGVSHVTKEKKQGILLGFLNRLKMIKEIILVNLKLRIYNFK